MSQPSISFSRLSKFIAMAVNNDNDGERANALDRLRDFHSSGFAVSDVNVATMRENEEFRREIEKTMAIITDGIRALHDTGIDIGFVPHRHKTISQRAELLVSYACRDLEVQQPDDEEPKKPSRWEDEHYDLFAKWVEDNRHQLKFDHHWAADYIRYAKTIFPDLHIGDTELIRGKWRVLFNETIWSEDELQMMLDNRDKSPNDIRKLMGKKYSSNRGIERLLDPKVNEAARRRISLRQ